eukprot:scaffold757_cov246-Pinguiococcus_pyrenoidosus.AAC.31
MVAMLQARLAEALEAQIREAERARAAGLPWSTPLLHPFDALSLPLPVETTLPLTRLYSARAQDSVTAKEVEKVRREAKPPAKKDRIVLGYVSSLFQGRHPMTDIIRGMLRMHDRSRFAYRVVLTYQSLVGSFTDSFSEGSASFCTPSIRSRRNPCSLRGTAICRALRTPSLTRRGCPSQVSRRRLSRTVCDDEALALGAVQVLITSSGLSFASLPWAEQG